MNIWAKMITALRGGVHDLGETIIDGQALRILDQEVREASEELLGSKQALANILAKQKLAELYSKELTDRIAENENYAVQALAKKEDELAFEVAQKIAGLEADLHQQQSIRAGLTKNVTDLRAAVKVAEQNIKRLKQQVDTIRATENVQRAQAAMAQRYQGAGNNKLRTAMDSLETIKRKQLEREAQLQAATELAKEEDQDPLMEKLAKAGIIAAEQDAQDVLARLRKSIKK